ncbi:MAG TPA: aminotransferase class I/II-fold pyridoxal phosphate-dependent enzyme [Blastocatellia bacterium]|nr:aminotransferase class I/II-fold pyridoxal phosphate-dependent enzyme [Blastocatellia bacterium]
MSDSRMQSEKDAPGDMSAEEFRKHGHEVVDWIADYLSHAERYPVLSQNKPGEVIKSQPATAPAQGESMQEILADIDRVVVPGVTHWNHPAFFAYFSISGSFPGILGEMFAAAFNVNAMLWRTSPSATELEEVTLNWLRQMLGLPEEFSGVVYDTASISTLCAIAAAREAVPDIRVREEGLAASGARLRLYCSEQTHSSIEKGAITLGIGQAGVRKIPTDSEFRMDADALARAIKEDRAQGWRPFCVVATIGTTSTTSVDPVSKIADICEREKLWLHVDAAYGGTAAILPEMKWAFEGWERADSIVMNPHKWMFVPVDLSALYCRRMDALRQSFSLVPEYLRTGEKQEVHNFMDYGPQLGRRFRALKLWFVLRYFGVEGIKARIRNHIEMAREFAGWVDDSRDFERLAPTPFSTVCFRAFPREWRAQTAPSEVETRLDSLNERLMEEVNREGKIFLSHTKLNGRFTLRLAIGNIRTTREHVRLAWERLNSFLTKTKQF